MFRITTLAHLTDDTNGPLLCLTTRNGSKHLFGKVPEGSQRILNALGEVRYGKLQNIFITGSIFSWSDIGGLPGLFLTISDATKKGVSIVGCGRLLSFIVATWRQFVFRIGISLNIVDVETSPDIQDEEMIISTIKIDPEHVQPEPQNSRSLIRQIKKLATLMFPLDTREVNSRDPESYKSDPAQTDIHTHVQLPEASKIVTSQASYSYCIRVLPVRGKFDAKKAIALGVKPGPTFGKLSEGQPVVAQDGTTVFPEQVLGPEKVFPTTLIIDIPSNEYYNNTINSHKWFEKKDEVTTGEIGLVYHFLGEELDFDLSHYKENFLSKFPSDTYHVISHRSLTNNVILNEKFTDNILKLKSLMNENFNLVNSEQFRPLSKDKIDRLHTLQTYQIAEQKIVPDTSQAITLTNKGIYDKMNQLEGGVDYQTMEQTMVDLNDETSSSLKDKVQICMLGTGSALPSISRNVLGNLLRIPFEDDDSGAITYRSIILDGGENTIGSLLRAFGHDNHKKFDQIFKELSLIHLSHLHADHHLGLISLIGEWFKMNKDESKKLYLVVPWQFITFVKDWYSLESQYHPTFDINRLICFSCEDFCLESRFSEYIKISMDDFEKHFDNNQLHNNIPRDKLLDINYEKVNQMYEDVGMVNLSTVRALHCAWSYSSTFEFKLNNSGETFKVSFSGDTRPNARFAQCGYGSDLLIHEASLDANWIEEAIAKKHSTMIEAVVVSQKMKCPKLILTHFSSRYGNSNNCVPKSELDGCAKEMNSYLETHRSPSNIFKSNSNSQLKLEDIDILFAYDLMSVRYGDLHKQEQIWPILSKIFEPSTELDTEKINEKKEAKRLERLELMDQKKKRRKSNSRSP
ncbi:TRZ1 Ribonuclease Z [Candida maltosa Xu316]|uniref:ribonuclease Z n=1 Tax=Candida maltosa (strain Xu316) TaxID=1245528 RepID=M3JSV6_CANMX|nr:hypothetical protein G210_4483 [Candida maltosa Xu316]